MERIRKIRIDLLPLRERPEDISLLVKSYIANIGILDKEFSDDGLEYMKSLPWSGNIRELKGFIDRCVAEVKIPIITSRQIKNLFPSLEKDSELVSTPENDLYDSFSENLLRKGISFSEAQTQLEKTFLKKSIDRFDSIRDLAEANGLNRKTLGKRLIALGISRS